MGAIAYDHSKEFEFQIQIGSNLFNEYPLRSQAERFYQLRKALGAHSTNTQINMVQRYYRDHKFAIGISTEKLSGASFTSFNTKAGDLLTIKLKRARSK